MASELERDFERIRAMPTDEIRHGLVVQRWGSEAKKIAGELRFSGARASGDRVGRYHDEAPDTADDSEPSPLGDVAVDISNRTRQCRELRPRWRLRW